MCGGLGIGAAHFGSCLVGCEHPLDASAGRIALLLPCGGLGDEARVAVDAPVETLAARTPISISTHVEPAGMFGDVVELQSAQHPSASSPEGLIERAAEWVYRLSSTTRCVPPWSFHYVPKHASWLNMVEIEIGVLARQCLDRRIDSYTRLVAETAAWQKQRNAARARIKWMFTTDKARAKWAAPYPKPAATSARSQRVKSSVTRY